jgi:putative addiction module component (TIGR02574 family)
MKKRKNRNITSHAQFTDEQYGKLGTPKRDKFEKGFVQFLQNELKLNRKNELKYIRNPTSVDSNTVKELFTEEQKKEINLLIQNRKRKIEFIRGKLSSSLISGELTVKQKRLLDKELADNKKHPDKGSSWEDVKARIVSKRKSNKKAKDL